MVSIVIPAFNCTNYIGQSLQSCFSQTYTDFEVIVVDDCSDEDIYSAIKGFDVKYVRNNKNIGPAGSRNIGIQLSKGDYISFIDSDDLMNRYKLEKSVKAFESDPEIGLVCGNYQILIDRVRLCPPFYRNPIKINHDMLMNQNFVASGSTTVKRDVLEDIGNFNEEYWIGEDYDLWIRIAEKYKVCYLHDILYYYSIVKNGNSLTQRDDIQKNHIKNIDKIKFNSKKRVYDAKHSK